MDKLADAIKTGKSDVAFFLTCMCIQQEKHEDLENVLIEVSAQIGCEMNMPFVATWKHINHKLLSLIECDQYHIADVLELVAMLSLLHQRLTINETSTEKKAGQAKLRKQIVSHFPDDARLSYRGQEMFQRIIPKQPADVTTFVHRILAGFSRLLEQKRADECYLALVYLSRRQIKVPLPEDWVAPDKANAEQGDPVWLLWGMFLLYFDDNFVATNWRLFCCHWKKKWKTRRIGLLHGIAFLLRDTNHELVWSKHEQVVLERVKHVAPQLWQECIAYQHETEPKVEEHVHAFETFDAPRNGYAFQTHEEYEATPLPKKTISLNGNKEKMDIKQKITRIKKLDFTDASSYLDSRDRRVGAGAERARISSFTEPHGPEQPMDPYLRVYK